MADAIQSVPAEIIEFSLGGFKLDTFEVPEEFDIGHEVSLSIHKYIDEKGQPRKDVHAMGAYAIPTQWKGELYGATALQRHYIFDNLCTAQQEIPLVFGPLKFSVMIKSYRGKIRHQNLVLYTLEIEIVEDLNGAAQSIDGTAQFNQAMEDAYTRALGQVTAIDPSMYPQSIQDAHAALTTQVAKLQPLQFASMADLQKLLAQVNAFNAQVQKYLGPLQATGLGANQLGAFLGLTNALNGYSVFAQNLAQIAGGPVKSAVTATYQAGVTLFHVAAHHYPNQDIPSTAQAIAQANGLKSMFLTTSQTLSIPPIFR